MTDIHIFSTTYHNGMEFLVKAESVLRAWGIVRQEYEEELEYRGTVDEKIPGDEGVVIL